MQSRLRELYGHDYDLKWVNSGPQHGENMVLVNIKKWGMLMGGLKAEKRGLRDSGDRERHPTISWKY